MTANIDWCSPRASISHRIQQDYYLFSEGFPFKSWNRICDEWHINKSLPLCDTYRLLMQLWVGCSTFLYSRGLTQTVTLDIDKYYNSHYRMYCKYLLSIFCYLQIEMIKCLMFYPGVLWQSYPLHIEWPKCCTSRPMYGCKWAFLILIIHIIITFQLDTTMLCISLCQRSNALADIWLYQRSNALTDI